jgi:hypothetical protein
MTVNYISLYVATQLVLKKREREREKERKEKREK